MSEMKTQREADWFGSRLTLADPFGPACRAAEECESLFSELTEVNKVFQRQTEQQLLFVG